MIHLRKSSERGHFDFGWLDTRHTFSFSEYYDPRFMGFRSLRVINEDRVAPGQGFPTHPHQSMEIFTYVLDGALEHKDSMGNGSVIKPGDVQRMSAGRGITHSEYNASKAAPVHFLQIWILPKERGGEPGYEQRHFSAEDKAGRLRLVMSPDGREGSVRVQQDVEIHAARLEPGQTVEKVLAPGRHGWLQVARGGVALNGQAMYQGDGAAITEESSLQLEGLEKGTELLLFDLS
jgi:redox-sensitive bicupin YhaK (pirin superfamily)